MVELVKDMSGFGLLTSQLACNIVEAVSNQVLEWEYAYLSGKQLVIPFLLKVDIYDTTCEEILLLKDAIGVKSQKRERNSTYYKRRENSPTRCNSTSKWSKYGRIHGFCSQQ